MDNEKLEILRLLIENKGSDFTIRQIAIKRKINYKSAYNNIRTLKDEGVISLTEYGNSTICRFNDGFNESVFMVEKYRLYELLKRRDFQVLYDDLAKLDSQFVLLLFGSYAKKTESKNSDIDLLLISDNFEPVESRIDLLPLNIHLTAISCREFVSMLKSREFSVVSEAIKHNILIFGMENYYRLMQHGGKRQ